jgi:hypothetical protein
MVTDLLIAAREYVTTKAAEGVVLISPIGLARLLKVDEWTATQLLAKLQREDHLVKVGGFVYCASCGEATRLEGGTIGSIKASAIALVGKPCACCGNDFPRIDRIEVRLSFFCLPAAKAAGAVHAGRSQPPATSSPLKLDQLDQLTVMGDLNVIHANDKASVAIDSQVGNKAGGDFAGKQMNKAGRDQRVSNAPPASNAESPVPLLKNYKFWAVAIPAIAGIVIAVIKRPGSSPATPAPAPTPAPSLPVQTP